MSSGNVSSFLGRNVNRDWSFFLLFCIAFLVSLCFAEPMCLQTVLFFLLRVSLHASLQDPFVHEHFSFLLPRFCGFSSFLQSQPFQAPQYLFHVLLLCCLVNLLLLLYPRNSWTCKIFNGWFNTIEVLYKGGKRTFVSSPDEKNVVDEL